MLEMPNSRAETMMAASAPSKCFLVTGPPGVGKTTLVMRALETLAASNPDLKIQGFYTREVREGNERVGFDVVTVDGKKGPLASSTISRMQTLDFARLREGNSFSRPPYFDGRNYPHWKVRMKFYLRAQGRQIWDAVKDGYVPPNKCSNEFTPAETKIELANDQAVHYLFCALSENVFNRVSACETAKEVWEKLEVHYEGTIQVKQTKLRILEEHYETFRVDAYEDIASAITRFTKVVNEIKNLGVSYSQEKLIHKFLRGLPKEWDAKKYAIQQAQNLGDYTFDALCGELTVHELELKDRERFEALGATTKKETKKEIALKASSPLDIEDSSCDDEDLEEEEVAILSRKLNKVLYKRDKFKKNFRSGSKGTKSSEMICYNCGKLGHMKADCKSKKKGDEKRQLYDKKKKSKKSLKATWDDLSSSSSDFESENEKAILCLMAKSEGTKRSVQWHLDSGCSRHMTGDAGQFTNLEQHDGGSVTFGDNNKGKVIGIGTVESLRWPCVGKYRVDIASFESLVIPELQVKDDTDLFIIDEVGKMELLSSSFFPAVLNVLNSNIPLLATVPIPKFGRDIPGVARLKNHPGAALFTLNKNNRDAVKEQIYSRLSELLHKP